MPLLTVRGLTKSFQRSGRDAVHAVNDVSFEIDHGETLALIGESGSGKSTIGRLLLRLLEPDAGTIELEGTDLLALRSSALRAMRAKMQVVFQEPYESLNPKMRVGDIVAEPLQIHEPSMSRTDLRERVRATLEEVGLDADQAERFPRGLSGGQQQRVGIARALITRPALVVLDEPTSSLDLSVQAQILEILHDLQEAHGLSYLYISHDLSTVSYLAHRVAVLYLGQIREQGPLEAVVQNPQDPYTQALLAAFLDPDVTVAPSRSRMLAGEIPDPTRLPEGCFLYGRCPVRVDSCRSEPSVLRLLGPKHYGRCIRAPLSDEDWNDASDSNAPGRSS
ncbi:MAG: ABC transporter ATP-binding protein [Candidatus Nanopelagicales bacterium]|nr:ABC transporter ATP-binding protein [Candidatus Nanopelagicales bacterium]